MTKPTTTITFLLALAGCHHGAIPEGRYPCTSAPDCPPNWYCHTNQLCYSTTETPPDAGTDAFASDAGPTHDAGPSCTTETCNGTDDDCDGLVDEGVLTVGPAVSLTTNDLNGGLLLPQGDGFGVLAPGQAMPSQPTWFLVDGAGAPTATPSLGTNIDQDAPWSMDAVMSETTVLVTELDSTANVRRLFGFEGASGARTVGTTPFVLPLPTGEGPSAHASFADASAGRATLYAGHAADVTAGPFLVRRYRLDISVDPPTVVDARDVITDGFSATGWALLGTPTVDYIVYYRSDRTIVLIAGPAGDATGTFHTVGMLGTMTAPRLDYASLAIRDPAAPVSATNPLGVAWAGRAGMGETTTASFAEVTNTTVFAATTIASFPDAMGAAGGFFVTHTVSLYALPDAPEHWIVAHLDLHTTSPFGAEVQVREIIGAGGTVRRISVPGELPANRADIGIAASGSTIRLVERANDMGLVTRSIGCE